MIKKFSFSFKNPNHSKLLAKISLYKALQFFGILTENWGQLLSITHTHLKFHKFHQKLEFKAMGRLFKVRNSFFFLRKNIENRKNEFKYSNILVVRYIHARSVIHILQNRQISYPRRFKGRQGQPIFSIKRKFLSRIRVRLRWWLIKHFNRNKQCELYTWSNGESIASDRIAYNCWYSLCGL